MSKKKIAGIAMIAVVSLFAALVLHSLRTYHHTEPANTQTPASNVTNYTVAHHTNLGPSNATNSSSLYKLHDNNFQFEISNNVIKVMVPQEFTPETAIIPIDRLLFHVTYAYDGHHQIKYVGINLRPDLMSLYDQMGFSELSPKIAYVYPLFTQSAYSPGGFYDYYAKKCNSKCLTIPLSNDTSAGGFTSSTRSSIRLSLLNYSMITDVDVDKNPNILKKYDKIIILHNEYVTKKEFDAITTHPNVLYLFPNAMYAEVKPDYDSGTITLVRGHGYPAPEITNGFGWKYDNSQYEYDIQCDGWKVQDIPNGKMLNCYPAYRLYYDEDLWKIIKQLP